MLNKSIITACSVVFFCLSSIQPIYGDETSTLACDCEPGVGGSACTCDTSSVILPVINIDQNGYYNISCSNDSACPVPTDATFSISYSQSEEACGATTDSGSVCWYEGSISNNTQGQWKCNNTSFNCTMFVTIETVSCEGMMGAKVGTSCLASPEEKPE